MDTSGPERHIFYIEHPLCVSQPITASVNTKHTQLHTVTYIHINITHSYVLRNLQSVWEVRLLIIKN